MDDQKQHKSMGGGRNMGMGYGRFAAMIATSTVVMYGLMYLNTYVIGHVEYSQTRMWMAVVMGATMALIMLGFMWSMYKNKTVNAAILGGSVVAFALALWLVRSQETVDDVSYMKAMIPHHSIAIMTSQRAHIKDPEVRKIADRIIDSQVREITDMRRAIARLKANPTPDGAPDLPSFRDKGVGPPPPGNRQGRRRRSAGADPITNWPGHEPRPCLISYSGSQSNLSAHVISSARPR